MDKQNIQIVLDMGSRNTKALAFDEQEKIVHKICLPIKGQLQSSLKDLLVSMQAVLNGKKCVLKAITGANASHFAKIFGLKPSNGILSTYLGTKKLVPQAGAILEIAGEHAAFIRLSMAKDGENILEDFFVNSECSAGTGAFLEQEAHRLNLSIKVFARLAAQSTHAARIAGRCAVFAKTDAVHLHQNGVPVADICHSLCRSVAQNIVNELVLSREFRSPLVFVGGVAANLGIQKTLKAILNLDDESLIVPSDHLYAAAIGSILSSRNQAEKIECLLSDAIKRLDQGNGKTKKRISLLKPLESTLVDSSSRSLVPKTTQKQASLNKSFIGIDIGSTSTNIVCTYSSGDVLTKKTLPTQGQALTSVFRGLAFLKDTFGIFQPKAVGITGSGRKFLAEIIGADAVLNEITAHSLGGLHFFPQVDTIFDIGGQDSKFIRIKNGTVVDFAMNKVCSAGTGSFLEEMSELLGLKIQDEFAQEAFSSKNPADLGERCTIFMSSELMRKLQEGEKRKDLAAGLCYSVVKNYISRVVGQIKIGKRISFQGGVASNPAIVAALENFLQKPVFVHEHHEIAGALGAALFASRQKTIKSRFRGFKSLESHSIQTRSFECQKCSNNCSICFTKDSSGKRFYSGGLCDRYEGRNISTDCKKKQIDLFEKREELLTRAIKLPDSAPEKDCLGIPRALHFYDLIPFWSTFLNELGIDYRVSEPTSKQTNQKGTSICPTNPCLPLKTAYGHCLQLKEDGLKKIFVPSVSNLSFLTQEERMNHVCPASQAWPFTARSLFAGKIEFLTPTIRFSIPHFLRSDIARFGNSLGFSTQKTKMAFQKALQAQKDFYEAIQRLGKDIFSGLRNDKIYAVLLSRPYTVCDPTIWLHLKKIFDELDVVAIPMDMVPCDPKHSRELDGMYWYFGKRFLQTIDALTDQPQVVFIHLSNFGCGADSFIIHFVRQRLKDRSLLELEIDEHNQYTGISTRLEAFVHSLKRRPAKTIKKVLPVRKIQTTFLKHRKLLIPQMSVHAFAFRSSFRAFGVDAEVLPLPDKESISYGKCAVSGGECLPCSFVIGDMLKYLKNHQNIPLPTFFMISGDGPCRLGQYPYLQRQALDENGYVDAFIFDASQDQAFYDRFGILPAAFKRQTWQGAVAVDLLFRKWRETRPYVDNKQRFDDIYYSEIEKVCESIQGDSRLPNQLRDSVEDLDKLVNRPLNRKPVIAVLGENYIRCNPVANGKIADILEELGAEVWFPSLYEWVYYGNWTARLHCLYEKQFKRYFKLFLIDAVQHWDERKISRAIKGKLRNLKEPSMVENFKLASKYIPNTFEGETLIEVARTIDFFNKKVYGVIHVVPFGCMMGTIVETLSEQLSRDLSGFPIMTLHYDGQDYTSQNGKLEGFMIRARMWQKNRRKYENISLG